MCNSSSPLWKSSGGGGFVQLLNASNGCSVDGCKDVIKAKKLCSKHYQRAREKPPSRPKVEREKISCRSCSGFFSPRRPDHIYCGVLSCRRKRTGCKPRDELRNYKCSHCGVDYKSASGRKTIYCSKKCKTSAWIKANPARKAELSKRYATKARAKAPAFSKVFFNKCRVCSKKWTSKASALVCSYKCHSVEVFRAAAKETACTDCKTVFCPTYEASRGRPSPRCQVCQDVVLAEVKRANRSARKAKMLAATVEKVDPFKVFDRDKWQCQDCGVSTPRALRGSYDDDAPELDHIKPLSKGGAHSYRNTQCLCRRCNLEKSDTWQPHEEENLLPA